MAVYTYLSENALRHYARMFGLGDVLGYKEVGAGSINSIYDVQTSTGRYFLRILENRTLEEARFEEALLRHLLDAGLPVPVMMQAAGHGGVVPYSAKQFVSVFKCMEGREAAIFEVQPSHAFQIGQFMAQVHLSLKTLHLKRKNHFLRPALLRKLQECEQAASTSEMQQDVAHLVSVVRGSVFPRSLPRGIVHGDVFLDNARFQDGVLCGVLDFEMASEGIWAYDVAVAICDWAFLQGRIVPSTAMAMVQGYQDIRSFTSAEKEHLYGLCKFVAARFATSRMYDFDVHTRPESTRVYKDYRHFMTRLHVLESMGSEAFNHMVFNAPSTFVQGAV
jgi:homoserine kinase type II